MYFKLSYARYQQQRAAAKIATGSSRPFPPIPDSSAAPAPEGANPQPSPHPTQAGFTGNN
jgi:hypothetical protein